jgi:hypothetical protein
MTVSKAGTEALAATVTVNTCTRTDRDWLEDVREKSAEREDFQEMVGEARVELEESAAVGRVYVVMGEPSKILNAHEATTLDMVILLWRAQEETRNEILPDGIAVPEARSTEDLKRIVETWLQYGELSIVSKRQTALHYAYGKRDRNEVEPPWMVTITMSDAKVGPGSRSCSSFGKLVGQLVLGFEKRDAPMYIQRRMQKPPRPWCTGGRKKAATSGRGRSMPAEPWRRQQEDRTDGDSRRPDQTRDSRWTGQWNGSRGQGSGKRAGQGNYARAVMQPTQKKEKVTPTEEATFKSMLEKATDRFRGNPSGIAAITERTIAAMGLKPDRNEVLAVTANILAYRKATSNSKGKHKRRLPTEEMSVAVRECLQQYSSAM